VERIDDALFEVGQYGWYKRNL